MTVPFDPCRTTAAGERDKPMSDTKQESLTWETPAFVEIRMDAEIGSYQDDFDGEDWN